MAKMEKKNKKTNTRTGVEHQWIEPQGGPRLPWGQGAQGGVRFRATKEWIDSSGFALGKGLTNESECIGHGLDGLMSFDGKP